jgi:hypothetical protein
MEEEDAFGAVSVWACGVERMLEHREWRTHSAISPSLGGHIDVRFLDQHLARSYSSVAEQRVLTGEKMLGIEPDREVAR